MNRQGLHVTGGGEIQDYTIIALAPNPWRGPWMNRQQILSRLGRANTVVYSNGTWQSWQRSAPEWRGASWSGHFDRSSGVWLDFPPAYLMRWARWPAWDRTIAAAHAARLRQFSKTHGRGPLVAFLFHPAFYEYADMLRADFTVYYAYDSFRLTPGWTAAEARVEDQLLERADIVFASSSFIAAPLRGAVRDVVVVPNGANVHAFLSAADALDAEPPDVAAIPRPRIGYSGRINRKLDLSLVEQLASRHKNWSFVFVGGGIGMDEQTSAAVDRCERLGNVWFLGHKDSEDVPRYVAAMDVNIMCYTRAKDIWAHAGYPLKLHEYLAAGRPVVGTDLPVLLDFKDVVAIATSVEEWEAHITAALDGRGAGTVSTRRAVAAMNDWDQRAALVNDHLVRALGSRKFRAS